MRRDVILAIVAGGTLGLVIAFGVWKINTSLKFKDDPTKTSAPISQGTNPPSAPENFKVVLAKPDSQAVFTTTSIEVSGVTKPGSYVVVSGELGDEILNAASDSGTFTSNVDLDGGINQINVSAFDTDETQADTNVVAIYSSQFVNSSSSPSISYIGTVTDITNQGIQIKAATGDIEQILTTENSTYVKSTATVTKDIKSGDVAIGDFIVAMGTKDGNNILDASRILVTDPITKTKTRAFMGSVTDDTQVGKDTVKNDKTGETITITPATGIQITGVNRFSQINSGDKLILVGDFDKGNINTRLIKVLK